MWLLAVFVFGRLAGALPGGFFTRSRALGLFETGLK